MTKQTLTGQVDHQALRGVAPFYTGLSGYDSSVVVIVVVVLLLLPILSKHCTF